MLSDLRYAVRTLMSSPVLAATAVVTLALGIGANAAVFSVVHAVLLRPLPYAEPDRLVRIWESNPAQGIGRGDVSPGSFVDWRSRTRSLERIGVFMVRDWMLSVNGEMEAVQGASVSPSIFPMLGVKPILGRTFGPEGEPAPAPGDESEIVISHALWRRWYAGRSDAVGQTIQFEGTSSYVIIGVMPAGFTFPPGVEAWRSETFLRPIGPQQRTTRYYGAVGQLRRGVTLDNARADLDGIEKSLQTEQPGSNAGYTVRIERLDETMVGDSRAGLLALLAVVFGVLLIACANVASLLLARATTRRHEVAVRLALGAGWMRILRQGLADSIVLTIAGAGLGCGLGYASMKVLVAMAPGGIPRLDEVEFSGPVFAFSAMVAFLGAVLTGLAPVLQARRLDVHRTLQTGGRSGAPAASRRVRGWLIGGQVALTLVLLVGSVLLLRSFVALRGVDLGFDGRRVLTAQLRLSGNRFPETNRRPWFRLAQHYDAVLANLAAIPGVAAVGGITGLPLTGEGSSGLFWLSDAAGTTPDATHQFKVDIGVVTPGYFDAMGIPLRQGRAFTAADRLSETTLTEPNADRANRPSGAAIVNEAFVRRYLSGVAPLDASIKLFDHAFVSGSTIVGVVGDVRSEAVATSAEPAVYLPFGEMPGFRLAMALRTTGSPLAVAGMVRERLRQLDPQMTVLNLRPMDDVTGRAIAGPRFSALLVGSFALLALSLVAVGIYGIVGFMVASRTREIAVRMALGARRTDVVRLVLGDGLAPVVLGLTVGCSLALLALGAVQSLLFGVPPFDPASFGLALALLGAVAVVAALIPARRAAGVDPLAALRQD